MKLELFRLSHLARYAALVAVVGCGEVHGPPGPDAASDTTPPHVVSVTPADHATRVSPLARISVVFDEPLDPASIDGTKVRLRARYLTVPGDVSYDDATRTLTFTPAQPLLWSRTCRLELGAFADLAGNTSEPSSTTFSTAVNAATRRTRDTAGNIYYRTDYVLDANGNLSEQLGRAASGPDGVWGSADDVTDQRIGWVYRADGVFLERRIYTGPGPDQTWLSPDDEVRDLTRWTPDDDGRVQAYVVFDGPGLDATWGTSDDAISQHVVNAWQGDNLVQVTTYDQPGPDGQWQTPDDVVGGYTTREVDAAGHPTRLAVFGDPGADGTWHTADDVPTQYSTSEYDAGGYLVRRAEYTGPGADGKWFTADDEVSSWVSAVNTPTGLPTQQIKFQGPGPDLVWFTADDAPALQTSYVYDDRGLMTANRSYREGPDGQIGTADDVQVGFATMSYDDAGNRVEGVTSITEGADGSWETVADNQKDVVLYDGAH